MKLLLGVVAMLIIIVGYYVSLCGTASLAMNRLAGIQQTYSSVAATTNEWQAGDTSTVFVRSR